MLVLLWIVSYRHKPVLTYAISGNVVGGVGEFGEQVFQWSSRLLLKLNVDRSRVLIRLCSDIAYLRQGQKLNQK